MGTWLLYGSSRDPRTAPVESMAAWLEGLAFVRDRLTEALAEAGVRSIATDGEFFDPRLHVAVDIAPAENGCAPGAIVRETRAGYVRGETVVRYAEVVVARD